MSMYPGQDGLRTPLKVARGNGASHTGVHHWWLQRVTAVALVPLSIWFLFFVGGLLHADHAAVLAAIAQPLNAILLIVLVASMFWHGALGLQVVIEDYVHSHWLTLTLQVALRLGAVLCALAGVMAVLSVWLGGAGLH